MSGIDRFDMPLAFTLAILGLAAVWLLRRGASSRSITMATPGLQIDLPVSWRARTDWLPALLRGVAIALLAVAIARPQEVSGETKSSTEGIAIQLVVDRSSSMEEPMLAGNRQATKISVVRDVVSRFVSGDEDSLEGREGDLIGLISFARYADTICPLVRSHEAVAELALGIETATSRREDGTAIGEAIALAAARLKRAEEEVTRAAGDDASPEFSIKGKAIILLTDGVNNAGDVDPIPAANLAAEWGIKIYAIGIGGPERRSFFSRGGVDEATLRRIADQTGGRYYNATSASALEEVYAEIDSLETTEIKITEFTNVEELFPTLALAALVILLAERLVGTLVYRSVP